MSDDDAPMLGVAAYDPPAGEDLPPGLEEPTPAADEDLGPVRLDRQGRKAVEQALRLEGEFVRTLRGVPPEEPTAWRWTDAEIDALMPALEGLTERYGIAAKVNEHAPTAGAVMALAGHATRSLAAERAWRAAHPEHEVTDDVHGPFRPEPSAGPDGPVREPAPAQPGSAPGPVDVGGVADLIHGPGLRGGR